MHSEKLEEDPIVMYLIVNESLNMSIGKTAAQVGHAVQLLLESLDTLYAYPEFRGPDSEEELERKQLFETWRKTHYTKITLKADSKEFEKLKTQLTPSGYLEKFIIVKDNGLTEIPVGSETVIGLFPIHKSQRPKIIKRLQALK